MNKPTANNYSTFIDALGSHFYRHVKDTPIPYVVAIISVDYLKGINLFYKEEHAQALSKDITQRIVDIMGSNCHAEFLGHDEFALFMSSPDTPEDEIAQQFSALISQLTEPFEIDKKTVYIYTHTGIEIIKAKYPSFENAISNAKLAMNFAKIKGHNQYTLFSPAISLYTKKPCSLLKELNRAVENKEFILEYQPQINPKSNKVMGFEALIRWEHPRKGTILPMHFISTLEDNKIMLEIGEWIFEQACITLAEMQKISNEPLTMSINVSATQLKAPSFSEFAEYILRKYSIQSNRLILEITETSLLHIEPLISMTLTHIASLGVQIVLDDFGTGYASFLHLKQFPISGIKIDSDFVKDLPRKKDSQMFEAIVEFSSTLGLHITVEGIENELQHQIMQDHDEIESVQGFLYAKAVQKEVALHWLQHTDSMTLPTVDNGKQISTTEAMINLVTPALPETTH